MAESSIAMMIYLPLQGSHYMYYKKCIRTLTYMHHCIQRSLLRVIKIFTLVFALLYRTDRVWTASIGCLAYPLKTCDLLRLCSTQNFLIINSLPIISSTKIPTEL